MSCHYKSRSVWPSSNNMLHYSDNENTKVLNAWRCSSIIGINAEVMVSMGLSNALCLDMFALFSSWLDMESVMLSNTRLHLMAILLLFLVASTETICLSTKLWPQLHTAHSHLYNTWDKFSPTKALLCSDNKQKVRQKNSRKIDPALILFKHRQRLSTN